MYKIIGADKKEYGPVTAAQLHHWISEGRANAHSLVRAEGSMDWNALGTLAEFADALRVHAEPIPASEPPPLNNDAVSPSEILARQPELKFGSCLAQGWALFTSNFILFFTTALLVWFLGTVSQLNLLTGLVFWVFHGALYGGLCLVFIKRIRNEPASVGDTFSGFRLAFAQLLLVGCITSFLSGIGLICCLLPGIYLIVAWTFALPLVADRRMEFWSAMELSRKTVTRIWFPVLGFNLLAFLPSILASLFLEAKLIYSVVTTGGDSFFHGQMKPDQMQALFTQVIETNVNFIWAAKVIRLLNMPFAYGVLMYGYENLFGTRKA